MILLLAAAQVLGAAQFEPPFVFAGERFHVRFQVPGPLRVESAANLALKVVEGGLEGRVLRPASAHFWTTLEGGGPLRPIDASRVEVPVAVVPKWRRWPGRSGLREGTAFLIGPNRSLALVPLADNYGLMILADGRERRLAPLLRLDVAARFGPRRPRPFRADYLYAGRTGITLLAGPGEIMRISLRLTEDRAELTIAARYDLAGEILLLGVARDLDLRSGKTLRMAVDLSALPPS
ncbi:MAG: hypothetical protein IH851_13115 [Armatimonadetes bacterium]|nr:hypothetical protein [Armatimonadota bacterium]